jgi:hypothetical protein
LAYLIHQKGVNVNAKGRKGCNLLHLTCIENYEYSVALSAKFDSILCLIVETIAERCIQHVFDGERPEMEPQYTLFSVSFFFWNRQHQNK